MSKTARPTARKRTAKSTVASSTARPARKRASPAGTKTTRKAPRQAAAKGKRPGRSRVPADVSAAIKAAKNKLAADVTVLDLRDSTAFTDFFIICTGTNVRQVQAIADAVEAELRAKGQKPALVEGYRNGEWVLLDYFDFIVHVFLPAQRAFYALERLWGGAESIDVSQR